LVIVFFIFYRRIIIFFCSKKNLTVSSINSGQPIPGVTSTVYTGGILSLKFEPNLFPNEKSINLELSPWYHRRIEGLGWRGNNGDGMRVKGEKDVFISFSIQSATITLCGKWMDRLNKGGELKIIDVYRC